MIQVEINRVLCQGGHKPFYLTCKTHKIHDAWRRFSTLTELKKHFDIKEFKKNGIGWAIGSLGRRHEWNIYEAEISEDYIINS